MFAAKKSESLVSAGGTITPLELLETAAKCRFGRSIKVLKYPWATEEIDNLKFDIDIISYKPEIVESNRTVVDINVKEYVNHSETEADEALIRVRTQTKMTENGYCFSTTKGVNWGMGENIGAQLMAKVMRPANWRDSDGKSTEEKEAKFCYEQEEKIIVPPKSQVKAKITTYSVKYQQGYTLKLSLPANQMVKVAYKTALQRKFSGFNVRYIAAFELYQSLPDFREENGWVSFIQPGTLYWVGEGSTINKEVVPLS